MFLFVVISTVAAIYWGRKYWLVKDHKEEEETEMYELPKSDETESRIRDFLADEYENLRRPHTQRCIALILQQVAETRQLPSHPQTSESLSSGMVDMTGMPDGASGAARAANSI